MSDLPIHFWTMPEVANTTVTTKQLRDIQLRHGGEILACGYLWNIKRLSLGAGVYRLSLERKH